MVGKPGANDFELNVLDIRLSELVLNIFYDEALISRTTFHWAKIHFIFRDMLSNTESISESEKNNCEMRSQSCLVSWTLISDNCTIGMKYSAEKKTVNHSLSYAEYVSLCPRVVSFTLIQKFIEQLNGEITSDQQCYV